MAQRRAQFLLSTHQQLHIRPHRNGQKPLSQPPQRQVSQVYLRPRRRAAHGRRHRSHGQAHRRSLARSKGRVDVCAQHYPRRLAALHALRPLRALGHLHARHRQKREMARNGVALGHIRNQTNTVRPRQGPRKRLARPLLPAQRHGRSGLAHAPTPRAETHARGRQHPEQPL